MENLNKKSLKEYPITLKMPDVAEIMRINKNKAYELARKEDFPAIFMGKRIVVPKEAFETWLQGEANKSKKSGSR